MSTDAPLNHFLIVYRRADGNVNVQEFGDDVERAMDVYAETERKYLRDDYVEVVLIGSDSLETVKFTHSNYFGDATPDSVIGKYLTGI